MSINPAAVGVVVAPTLISTAVQHPFRRLGSEKRQLSFVEGVALIRRFLKYASHHDVRGLQKLTAQPVPKPLWVKCEHEIISKDMVEKAIEVLITQLGDEGIQKCGGSKWWQWRKKQLKWEYMEVRKRRKDTDKVIFYVHGGAYYFGSTDIHRYQIIRHLWSLPGSIAIAPRYRLAPQFPFPCGLLDILACYMQVERDYPKNKIIVMGDSAGAGLVLALLFIIRDRKLRMPDGATLLSPWCDLTHSFPSIIGDNSGDYIPPAGFLHRPSVVWPPPVHSQMKSAIQGGAIKSKTAGLERANAETGEIVETHVRPDKLQDKSDVNEIRILIHGKEVVIHDQIQLYANNSLLNYYLVSPVVAKDFSGLCPLLITGGAREVLRDEIMYIAHQAAHDGVKTQLMMFDEGCHVATTLAWTTMARYQFRAAANFGIWCTGGQVIQVVKDDDRVRVRGRIAEFEDGAPINFSRLRVNIHGYARQMESESELACLKVENIGTIKAGPVKRWMKRKEKLDIRYKHQKDKVQRLRAKELALNHGSNERPPPSAAYGREWTQDEVTETDHEKKISTGMALWSRLGLMSSFRKHAGHDPDDDERNDREREYDNLQEEERERYCVVVTKMNGAHGEEASVNGYQDALASIATLSIHADDGYSALTDVAAPLHVSSTYKYSDDPSRLDPVALEDPEKDFVYSRYQTPNTIRAEAVLAVIMKGECLLYANGMAAIHAVFDHVNPKTLALADAYSGVITLSKMYTEKHGLKVVPLSQAETLSKGDLIWLTNPINPTGLSVDIESYVAIAKKTGARVAVDSTFSPPPLSNPFDQGADIIIHSGSKYLGGHSDLLAGVIVVKTKEEKTDLFKERLIFGTSLGNMETWLLLRSMRTLDLRVRQASQNAEKLAKWLNEVLKQPKKHGVQLDTLQKVTHSSLQDDAFVKKQNPGGFGPVLSISLKDANCAKAFPSKLKYFTHATSLGGVESLIEWRTLSDRYLQDRALLRLSIGIEKVQDLQEDLLQALRSV